MKVLVLILVGMMMIGCGSTEKESTVKPSVDRVLPVNYKTNPSDPELHGYKLELIELLGLEGVETTFQFGQLKERENGVCLYEDNVVVIDREVWESSSNYNYKMAIVAHELFHCHMSMDHVEIEELDLMSPYTGESALCIVELGLEGCLQKTLLRQLEGPSTITVGRHSSCSH